MPRLLFEKQGNAVWISHLDLMRLFQRAFKRADLPLTHTKGFNPRPSVSIALPMSVGVESHCELLDFELEGEEQTCVEICNRLNDALPEGVRIRRVYHDGRKLKELIYLDCAVNLEYDRGVAADTVSAITELFQRETLIVEKRSKDKIVDQDIIPMIRSFRLEQRDENTLTVYARICCQNPTLNPAQICAAIERYLPQWKPDFSSCCRLEIYDGQEKIFR